MAGLLCSVVVGLIVLLSVGFSEARDYLVGGKADAWKIPTSDNADSLNHWAQNSRFLIGDSLVWQYDAATDSVLQVTKRDYVTCNTSSPIETYTGGQTKVKLEQYGPHYFISGAQGHCDKGQKLIVVVISDRHHRHIAVSPAPSPAETEGPAAAPAPAPTNGARSLSGGLLLTVALGAVLGLVM
ncbi:hypothetical protein ABFS83_01G034000 [Erythranthe nasuta]